MLKITNNREAFFQWDVGQSLVVDLEEGERITAVHIGNSDGCKFYVVEPIEGLIAVYDELLQSGKDIVAYEYIENDDEGHTVRRYDFTVVNRPKAEDYAYTPTQSYSWEYWAERARLYAESAAEEVANIPAKMEEWWEGHKADFKGDDGFSPIVTVEPIENGSKVLITDKNGTETVVIENGKDGKDGEDYILTDADKAEISRITLDEIMPIIDGKMEFYKVDCTGAYTNISFWHDGTRLYYNDLVEKYNDPKYFLYAEFEGLTFIPSLPPVDYDPILEFICTWIYGGRPHVARLVINSNNEGKYDGLDVVITSDLGEYTKKTYVDAQLQLKANVSDIPDPYDDTELRAEITSTKESLNQKVGFEDYAEYSKGGVIRTNSANGTMMLGSGFLISSTRTAEQYENDNNYIFISKGTLENVLNIERSKIADTQGELADTQNALAQAERKIKALTDLTKGSAWSVINEENDAYSVDVPSGCYVAEVESIEGNSVVWNQVANSNVFASPQTINGVTFTNNRDCSITINGTSTNKAERCITNEYNMPLIGGHKYYLFGCPSGGSPTGYALSLWQGGSKRLCRDIGNGDFATVTNTSTNGGIWISVLSANITVNNLVFKPRCIDLTQMFGAGNEPTTVDDPRIKWVEQYAEAHPEYNAGEIVSTQLSELVVKGKNLFDINWIAPFVSVISFENGELTFRPTNAPNWFNVGIPVDLPPFYYSVKITNLTGTNLRFRTVYEDGYIGDLNGSETATGEVLVTGGTSSAHGRIKEIRGNWTKAGTFKIKNVMFSPMPIDEYVPYSEQHIPFNVDLKSAGTVRDKWVDGKLTENVGVVDLGNLNWSYASVGFMYTDSITDYKRTNSADDNANPINAICPNYDTTSMNRVYAKISDKICGAYQNVARFCVYDSSYTDAASFKAAMSGVMLYYEKATPTTSEAPTLDQLDVEPHGSITFENDAKLSVKSTIEYAQNNSEV